ncbi:exopolysaccharide biosynthesis polyprenyl glycosylphosphotransferase [Billgrantia tianxiuensis]|uniref:Exopolysaccharide biosynthesis polyprenyl glycosylphosphotransferase n=1 Tax=Billgrantia tianxiuensis TaxID=2497861 RepID=A0A6I6SIB9_9GAMM|nr:MULTISPECIES: exopolysaccharide biosynthesis polyprenyl glycosylphosphotransferase [Halomonas]MCE8031562.1 exopolysaccharide biosynthesis polyprenyl glycosylphosphotransferase [Halomonas sp. MCCC 1A11057]QHC50279.1 exopolysaccharide biosynthesis polyprenyl glycosylphosphotransferase [Halomonas tianxiuensis]
MKRKYERRHSRWYEVLLLGLGIHVLVGLPLVILLPSLERWGWEFWLYLPDVRSNTIIAVGLAFMASALTLRRLADYPGTQLPAYILPTVSIAFLIAVALLFFTREGYTRQVMFGGYLASLIWFYLGYFIGKRYRKLKLALVPFGDTKRLLGSRRLDLRMLDEPDLQGVRFDGVVADLRAEDLPPEWEKFLATCTLCHIPVYHIRQIHESISGRVQIDSLSENEFGSLLPSLMYLRFKRLADTLGAILLLPVLLPIMLVTAILIKLDSPGPVFFMQPRVGYRARPFLMFKFRSMYHDMSGEDFTISEDDPRITRVGKAIRKYRIDELPQIFNILKGEMSFIGPRPESASLSEWYEQDVPFFSYRHVVRPGITGWAQVEQGYAAEVQGMTKKLQYDFYYIKHVSLWLDVLISLKTVRILFTGFGAR